MAESSLASLDCATIEPDVQKRQTKAPNVHVRYRAGAALRALRAHQWAKNLLVFLPLVLSHRLGERHLQVSSALAFAALSCCASAGYVWNDLMDVSADRQHPRKRDRGFASGALSTGVGISLIALLLLIAFALASLLPHIALAYVAAYTCLTMSYSLYLKRIELLDVLLLAALYSIRILLGGAATSIEISPWTLAFSMFLFFSLAMVKRQTEVLNGSVKEIGRRGYLPFDSTVISQFGIASGYIAILVIALYINSPEVSKLYSHPSRLWAVCPAVAYWISRMWLLTNRGEMHDDPLIYAMRDPASYAILCWILLVIRWAT